MRHRAARSNQWRQRGKRFFCLLLVLILISFVAELRLRPVVSRVCAAKVAQSVTTIFCETVEATLAEQTVPFTVSVLDTAGEIAAIEVVSTEVNRFQSQLLSQVNQRLTEYATDTVRLSLGTASDLLFFIGKGPMLRIRLAPVGSVSCTLDSSFSDAGINQTCHQLTLTLSVEIRMTSLFCSTCVTVPYTCMLSETILLGDLPEGIWNTTQ